jgi:predicted RNase H-like HicB family nuclease
MTQTTSRGISSLVAPPGDWTEHAPGTAYRCEVYLSQEGGSFVADTALPGITARGGSESEALENAQKAATEAIRGYKVAGQKIPWQQREFRRGEVARVVIAQV